MNSLFDPTKRSEILITCLPGLSDILKQELEELSFDSEKVSNTSVRTHGSFHDTYELNYCLRTASHIHYNLDSFRARDGNDIYKRVLRIEWDEIFPVNGYFSIQSFVRNPTINDNRFANLKLKDGVVDYFSNKYKRRPNSGPDTNSVVLYLHWIEDNATIYIDTSGNTLSRRGYRKDPWKAPLAESLAAGIILSTKWDRNSPIINPMGGSGTLIAEALMIASGKAPGSIRSNYAFQHILGYEPGLFGKIKSKYRKLKEIRFPVIYNDNKRPALQSAKRNLEAIGMVPFVDFQLGDFTKTRIPRGQGIVIINPPYGERLGEIAELGVLYSSIGDYFKQKCVNYTGYVFTANSDLAKQVGLRTSSKKVFYNAKLESRLLEFEMYTGTKKPEK